MSKLKYALTLVVGIAMGGSGTYFSRNLSNQRSMDENYLAGKEIGLKKGEEIGYKKGQPQIDVNDFNEDGLPDLWIILSNGKQYLSIDYNEDGAQDVIVTENGDDKSNVYVGSSRCPLPSTLDGYFEE